MSTNFQALLRQSVERFCALSDSELSEMEAHYRLLERWNQRMNLTAIRSLEEAIVRHYSESVFLAHVLRSIPAATMADVGSGGGFPGVPVAIVHPNRQIRLIESHQRKSVFLSEATRHLANVTVDPTRFGPASGAFDVVISRAVAWDSIAAVAARASRCAALLVGPSDVGAVLADKRAVWDAVPLPWPERGAVLIGTFHVKP